ncbi:aldo-keto reductase AKR2E4-like isoform X1 [Leptidea sinapis]|uniref:aldo-keto reductase AKR2E4-like isoform X1 n=1 Tax=Leptidea sinapis TaxID=189913 RepID=UPI002139653A|nr:aldo-keto reductase AKR2E4-like isoform X1 [Leptidea sinapis]
MSPLLLAFVLTIISYNEGGAVQPPTFKLNDGNEIPAIALGTGRGTAKESETLEDVRQAVYWAIEAGYRHIDTAAVYFDEEQVGQGIAQAIADKLVTRKDLYITTKLWNDKHRREQVVPALKDSLKKLGLDYVDLYLIHFPVAVKADGSSDDVHYVDTWKGMMEAKELGLTRSIGVSNFNTTQIADLIQRTKVVPAVNEIEVNPTLTQEALVNYCQSQGIVVMGYSPFGFLVSRRSASAPPPRSDDPVLVAMAQKYGKTTAQIVLRYLIERGIVPIPKSTNKARIVQNKDIFDFSLTPAEVEAINKFNKNIRVISISSWQNYPLYPFCEY